MQSGDKYYITEPLTMRRLCMLLLLELACSLIDIADTTDSPSTLRHSNGFCSVQMTRSSSRRPRASRT